MFINAIFLFSKTILLLLSEYYSKYYCSNIFYFLTQHLKTPNLLFRTSKDHKTQPFELFRISKQTNLKVGIFIRDDLLKETYEQ